MPRPLFKLYFTSRAPGRLPQRLFRAGPLRQFPQIPLALLRARLQGGQNAPVRISVPHRKPSGLLGPKPDQWKCVLDLAVYSGVPSANGKALRGLFLQSDVSMDDIAWPALALRVGLSLLCVTNALLATVY